MHTSASVSLRQHTSAYVTHIRMGQLAIELVDAYVSIRQHPSAFVSICHTHTHGPTRDRARRFICQHPSASVSIRQQTSAYVRNVRMGQLAIELVDGSFVLARHARLFRPPLLQLRCCVRHLRQHTSAYVSVCQHTSYSLAMLVCSARRCSNSAAASASCVSIRQHTSAYVNIRSIRQHTSVYVSIRQHTPAYVSIREHT